VIRAAARLLSFVRSALRGIAAGKATTAVAVATIGVTLVLVGAFLLLVSNMERLLDELSFSAPELSEKSITIDAVYVERMLADIVKNEDLSRYIL